MRYLWLVFVLINQSVEEDHRQIHMMIKTERQFSCAKTTCLPFRNLTVLTRLKCQLACLTQSQCDAVSFNQQTFNCQLFTNIFNQIGNMSIVNNIDTMIVIEGTRYPVDPWKCGRMTIVYNINIGGAPYIANYPQRNYTDCCNLCLANTQCRGFLWGFPNHTEEWQRLNCWLKNITTPLATLNGFAGGYL